MGIAKKTLVALLYCGAMVSANPSFAGDFAEAEALREGDMRKLIFSAPQAVSDETFSTPEGETLKLADFEGKTVIVNFWATWCKPCRDEMPSLQALRRELGGETFEVLTIATGPKNEPARIEKFYKENEITDLPIYLDPKGVLARAMAVRGLPITVVLDPDGQEIARLRGDADWASENAIAVLTALIDEPDS